jgi:hypothetical protein
MTTLNIKELDASKVLSGPYELFGKSFILEFIDPPASLDATQVSPNLSLKRSYSNPNLVS